MSATRLSNVDFTKTLFAFVTVMPTFATNVPRYYSFGRRSGINNESRERGARLKFRQSGAAETGSWGRT